MILLNNCYYLLLSSCHNWGNWDLGQMTQPIKSRIGIKFHIFQFQGYMMKSPYDANNLSLALVSLNISASIVPS